MFMQTRYAAEISRLSSTTYAFELPRKDRSGMIGAPDGTDGAAEGVRAGMGKSEADRGIVLGLQAAL